MPGLYSAQVRWSGGLCGFRLDPVVAVLALLHVHHVSAKFFVVCIELGGHENDCA
jgi:hypothetical protein